MEIKQKIADALNQQLNRELYSAYLYLAMSAHFEDKNLPGFAHWMRIQAKEEQEHALKFYKYIAERQGRVILKAIEAPPMEWKTTLDVVEHVYQHELEVTKLIGNLTELAEAEKDHATNSLLQWFINEQVEEEASAYAIIQQLKMIKDAPQGLIMLDRALAQRKAD